MTFMAVEDNFYDHTKVVALFDGPCPGDALALWTLAGSWSSRHLTEGHVPTSRVRLFGLDKRAAEELVRVRLWVKVGGGYSFHEWTTRNPTREAVETKRAKTAERVKKLRQKRMGNAVGNAPSNGVTSGVTGSGSDGVSGRENRSPEAPPSSVSGPAFGALDSILSNASGSCNAVTSSVVRVPPVPCPLSPASYNDAVARDPALSTAPRSDFGRFQERFWIVFVKWFAENRDGQLPIRTGHTRDAAQAVWDQASIDNIDPEQYAHALCDHYWRQEWPRDPANKPTVRNFLDQIDRLLPALREDWAEYIRPAAGAAE